MIWQLIADGTPTVTRFYCRYRSSRLLHAIAAAMSVITLGGCALWLIPGPLPYGPEPREAPIPAGYSGPTAFIRDSALPGEGSRVDYFFVSEVDARSVARNLDTARAISRGKGFSPLKPLEFGRFVPAVPLIIKLEGRSAHPTPLQEISNILWMHRTSEVLAVELEPDQRYVVRGRLGAGNSEVWLEHEGSGRRIGRRIDQP